TAMARRARGPAKTSVPTLKSPTWLRWPTGWMHPPPPWNTDEHDARPESDAGRHAAPAAPGDARGTRGLARTAATLARAVDGSAPLRRRRRHVAGTAWRRRHRRRRPWRRRPA